jgi:hypothetical protein
MCGKTIDSLIGAQAIPPPHKFSFREFRSPPRSFVTANFLDTPLRAGLPSTNQ